VLQRRVAPSRCHPHADPLHSCKYRWLRAPATKCLNKCGGLSRSDLPSPTRLHERAC
jgi:hypothetical protein